MAKSSESDLSPNKNNLHYSAMASDAGRLCLQLGGRAAGGCILGRAWESG
ncbi:MAG: hypothetical protein F6K31_37145 [Symploca sp. SIO2G7]|nr:hypothetical protein [Symploca sp. SIO2G7]